MNDFEAMQAEITRQILAMDADPVPMTREALDAALSREVGCPVTLGEPDPETGAYRSALVRLPCPIRTITIEGLIVDSGQ